MELARLKRIREVAADDSLWFSQGDIRRCMLVETLSALDDLTEQITNLKEDVILLRALVKADTLTAARDTITGLVGDPDAER